MPKPLKWPGLVWGLALALMLVSCGGGSSEEPQATEPQTEPTTTAPAAVSPTTTETSGDQGESPDLESTSWTVTHYASESLNSITNVWADTEITIRFGNDGSVSGNAGCNDFEGSYQVSGSYVAEPGFDEESGQAIEIANLSWTEIACDSENLMEQEVEFLDVLPRAEYWFIGQGFETDTSLLIRSVENGLLVEAIPSS